MQGTFVQSATAARNPDGRMRRQGVSFLTLRRAEPQDDGTGTAMVSGGTASRAAANFGQRSRDDGETDGRASG